MIPAPWVELPSDTAFTAFLVAESIKVQLGRSRLSRSGKREAFAVVDRVAGRWPL